MVISHPLSASSIYYDLWHPLRSIYVPNTICLQVFFGLSLGLAPSTSYSIHFFIQSLSSFRSTCPYHCNLFRWSTKIMSSKPSLSLNPLLGTLSCSLMPQIHLMIPFYHFHSMFQQFNSSVRSALHWVPFPFVNW